MTVINYGVGNTGNGRWIKILERDAVQYDPKLVVLQFCDNDFGDNVRERLYEVRNDRTLVELPVSMPSMVQRFAMWVDTVPLVSYSRLVSLGREVITWMAGQQGESVPTASPQPRVEDELTYAIVRRALAISAERRWPVVMLTVLGERPDRHHRLKALADEADVPLVEAPDPSTTPSCTTEWTPTGMLLGIVASPKCSRANRGERGEAGLRHAASR